MPSRVVSCGGWSRRRPGRAVATSPLADTGRRYGRLAEGAAEDHGEDGGAEPRMQRGEAHREDQQAEYGQGHRPAGGAPVRAPGAAQQVAGAQPESNARGSKSTEAPITTQQAG
ncbi:hypothetical protein AB0I77_25775 [Streptomyces sp. NPDC050619]|uniref:hypothetical protein n=1 Tax=Streptomyces sp. NPDC050619 TaxID=3157214 RepID=UPI0034358D84